MKPRRYKGLTRGSQHCLTVFSPIQARIYKKRPSSKRGKPYKWRRGRDSNPRVVSHKLISSQPRYDRFDTSPYVSIAPPFPDNPCRPDRTGGKNRMETAGENCAYHSNNAACLAARTLATGTPSAGTDATVATLRGVARDRKIVYQSRGATSSCDYRARVTVNCKLNCRPPCRVRQP